MVLLSDISPHELAFSFISMKETQYDGYQLFLSLENVVYSAITTPSDCFVPSNKQYICQKWNIVYTLYNHYTHDLFPNKPSWILYQTRHMEVWKMKCCYLQRMAILISVKKLQLLFSFSRFPIWLGSTFSGSFTQTFHGNHLELVPTDCTSFKPDYVDPYCQYFNCGDWLKPACLEV